MRLKNRDIDRIFPLLSKNQEIITTEQYNFLNKYWGFTDVKSPKKLRKLLLAFEGEYQLKNNFEKRFYELNSLLKPKVEQIKRLEIDTKLKSDQINALLLEKDGLCQIKNNNEIRLNELEGMVKAKIVIYSWNLILN